MPSSFLCPAPPFKGTRANTPGSNCRRRLTFIPRFQKNSPAALALSLLFFMSFQCSVTPCLSSRLGAFAALALLFFASRLGGPICRVLPLTRAVLPTSRWFIAGEDGAGTIVCLAQAARKTFILEMKFSLGGRKTKILLSRLRKWLCGSFNYQIELCEPVSDARVTSRTVVSAN